jgi:hypothetical protein
MYDTPYRIEAYRNNRHQMVYTIEHSGVGVICEVFVHEYARKIVDGLNKDARHAQANPAD